jgi:hypothetical protein
MAYGTEKRKLGDRRRWMYQPGDLVDVDEPDSKFSEVPSDIAPEVGGSPFPRSPKPYRNSPGADGSL